MYPAQHPILRSILPELFVTVRMEPIEYRVAFLDVRQVAIPEKPTVFGELDDSESRDVLNHFLDVLDWDP